MSLEQRCRERLLLTEDGRQAVALLDAWETKITELESEMEAMRTADPTELAAQIINLKQQLAAMQSGDAVCWHCYDVLQKEPDHCEKCPAFNQCDDDECVADGCQQQLKCRKCGARSPSDVDEEGRCKTCERMVLS